MGARAEVPWIQSVLASRAVARAKRLSSSACQHLEQLSAWDLNALASAGEGRFMTYSSAVSLELPGQGFSRIPGIILS